MQPLLGQDRALEALRQAIVIGRVHHAWIFHGPTGVGKRTAAGMFAAALLRPVPGAGQFSWESLLHSPEYAQVKSGNHADVHLINRELAAFSSDSDIRERKQITIPVDVIREFLINPASRSPVSAAKPGQPAAKVFVIDEAELMNQVAQNALLKTLEEPPVGTVVILVTAAEHRLLPTVRSRCQRVGFGPLSDDLMSRWLRSHAEKVPSNESAWLLEFASGSPGLAHAAIEHGLFAWHTRLDPFYDSLRKATFPARAAELMETLVKDFADGWVKKHPAASKDAANKLGAGYLFLVMGAGFRSRLRRAASVGHTAEIEETLLYLDRLHDAEVDIARNVNLGLALSNMVAQIDDASQCVAG